MARTKVSQRTSQARAETRAVLAELPPVSLDMPDRRELASPCPTPVSRKRKRSGGCVGPMSPAQANVGSESPELPDGPVGEDRTCRQHWRARGARVEGSSSWRSFKLVVCECQDDHAMKTIVMPARRAASFALIDDAVRSSTGRSPDEGVYTDLEGNQLLRASELWGEYVDSGIPGLVWHPQFYAGVNSCAAAQVRIKHSLYRTARAIKGEQHYENDDDYDSESEDLAGEDEGTMEQVTPAPLPVVLKQSNKSWYSSSSSSPHNTPWTAMTSSSTGQITHLENSESRSSIKRQALVNVFDEDEVRLWTAREKSSQI
ncbi:protein of unknown function [Taphrina deformans PYCC 5710]|uniref:Uncharacterized protein n=1 Tax=Taphrina deformans (strain PYCC 5710 / ATCC 11124 / CBS 356.35 / IMI 108563 / JCM 9778 / NBRC 8474) TaxID=1097556 RepID=R4X956_TAPDE|nr:protein of unknown function [Taphrina deformans PYCC 5710]|eukprot:CCG82205.1 protein of unknown function [Taphrina deformans PYCC 5710]